jgi:uncharacterized membrane protein
MSAPIWRRLGWLPPVLAVAVLVHVAAVWAAPRVVMALVLHAVAKRAGTSGVFHAPPVTAAARGIPLPSPDLLYSTCTVDFAHGPVAVSVTPGTDYISLAVFDGGTDNVFVADDQTNPGQPIRLILTGPGQAAPAATPGSTVVPVRTRHALVLLRALAATPELLGRAEVARRSFMCEEAK